MGLGLVVRIAVSGQGVRLLRAPRGWRCPSIRSEWATETAVAPSPCLGEGVGALASGEWSHANQASWAYLFSFSLFSTLLINSKALIVLSPPCERKAKHAPDHEKIRTRDKNQLCPYLFMVLPPCEGKARHAPPSPLATLSSLRPSLLATNMHSRGTHGTRQTVTLAVQKPT